MEMLSLIGENELSWFMKERLFRSKAQFIKSQLRALEDGFPPHLKNKGCFG